MKLEVVYGYEKEIQPGVQARGGEDGQGPGVALRQVARDLDLNENMLRRWIRESSEDPQDAFPGLGNMKPEQAEIARLQREVAKLKMERDILKKAAAYFAKESM